ncbi:MAG TPA: transglutaminase family protein [Sneathiellales bacterium]|nr:transglutaminase family protein [Sneathiellales bacterium]
MTAGVPPELIRPLKEQEDMTPYLMPTAFIDSDHPDISAFARKHGAGHGGISGAAVRLYYAVRDLNRYDPYSINLTLNGLKASNVLKLGRGWCVSKAILLAACLRSLGIPARLGYTDVRNHLSTEALRKMMKTGIFRWHGYTSIHLNGEWIKATPVFNKELCEKFRLATLEFNGREDSIYQPFDLDGNRHMEYLADHGEFADVPLDTMITDFKKYYPSVSFNRPEGNFEKEVDAETANLQAGPHAEK